VTLQGGTRQSRPAGGLLDGPLDDGLLDDGLLDDGPQRDGARSSCACDAPAARVS
jgi:hypothetical protein